MIEKKKAYLLQNQVNPFPICGDLVLDDGGNLSFTLNEDAAGASLGWLEKAIGQDNLKDRIQGGERPVVFNVPVKDKKIAWPLSLARMGMKFEDGDRKWVVSLEQPNNGAILQTLSILEGGKRSKPWKEALAEAGAK